MKFRERWLLTLPKLKTIRKFESFIFNFKYMFWTRYPGHKMYKIYFISSLVLFPIDYAFRNVISSSEVRFFARGEVVHYQNTNTGKQLGYT